MRPFPSSINMRLPGNKLARRASASAILTPSPEKDVGKFRCLIDSLERYVTAGRRLRLVASNDGECDECCAIILQDAMRVELSLKDPCIVIQTQVSLTNPLSNYRVMQLEDKELVHIEYHHADNTASLAQYLVLDDFIFLDEEY